MNMDGLGYQAISVKSPRRWSVVTGAVVLGLLGVTAWGIWQFRVVQIQESPSDIAVAPVIPTVTALGRLEPEGEMINLTAATSTQESRLERLLVEEGDRVEADQIVAILDSRDRLQAALQRAEEQVDIALAQLAQVNAGAKVGERQAQRAEIARLHAEQAGNVNTQRATIARLEAEVQNAEIEYQRYESLYQDGAISASERDSRQLTHATTQRQLQEAEAALVRIQTTSDEQIAQAKATLEQIAEVRSVDVVAAEAEVKSAIAAVAEAEANLEQAYVRSPQSGQIIEIHTYPGEDIADEGVVTLGETQHMMAIADVYQNDVAKIQPGQSASVTSPALPDTLHAAVERIGLRVERQQVVNEDPAANIDAKVVEVHLRLDPASSEKVAGFSDLQVTVKVQLQ